jgi:hypothetical protein
METNNTNPIQPEINTQPIIPQKNKTFPYLLILGIVMGVILTSSVASAVYFYQKSKTVPTNLVDNNSSVTSEPTISSPYKVTWLDKPQKINSLAVLISNLPSDGGYFFDKITFYLVANLGDGSQLIDCFLPIEGPSGSDLFRFIKSPDGQISIIKSDNYDQIQKYLLPQVSVSTLSFKELDPPAFLYVDNMELAKYYTNNETFDTLSNPKLIKSTDSGDLYVVYTPKNNINGVFTKSFYLKLKDSIIYSYTQKYNFISDNQTTYIKWNDNSTTEDQFNDRVHGDGCGGANGADIIKDGSSLLQNKVAVATYDQKTIYQIKDTNNLLLKEIYRLFKVTSGSITPDPPQNIDDFANLNNHFLYQDPSRDWIIFTNQKYAIQAECGKPVIYLYPEKETQVKVQVGAKITKSEPTYPQNGWTVTAKPNGELTYQNQTYPYLFWEGLGNGIYPNYQDRGTLVAQKDLISTLYKQLSQLGLNQEESADFMEFWQSKLPTTPYVRLTWLNTSDMDKLAPLTVSPKPNTKIRIFLEFAGLDKPINLIPQTLSSPQRTGFTLIEWGGLLLKNK